MTYNELFIAVKDYLQNDFPTVTWTSATGVSTTTSDGTEQVNLFIKQAEQRIYNSVQFPALRKNVTGSTTSGTAYLACPDDFLAPYSMAVINSGAYSFLLNKDVNFIREAYPTPADTGLPAYYALFGPRYTQPAELSFILGPTPDATYTMELHYFFYPESIVTASTSWLGDNFDSVLLYGALVEGYTFLKGETDLIQLYDGKFKEALALAKRMGDGMDRMDAYRSGQYKQPVT